jgi:hypothetical protein
MMNVTPSKTKISKNNLRTTYFHNFVENHLAELKAKVRICSLALSLCAYYTLTQFLRVLSQVMRRSCCKQSTLQQDCSHDGNRDTPVSLVRFFCVTTGV